MHVARGGKAGAIVEDATAVRIGHVSSLFARPLRQRILAIVHWQIAIASGRPAEQPG
jgi:hypothetical protein